MSEPILYGGQAVIEGVMMRGPQRMAIAVRRPDGEIAMKTQELNSLVRRYRVLRLPVLRGFVALIEALTIGTGALLYSAEVAAPEEEKLSKNELTLSSILGFGFAILVFFVLPTWLGSLLRRYAGEQGILFNLFEGVLRITILLAYLKLVSLMKDIQRVFQYHGAEHKVINTWEAGDALTVEQARRHSREHKRCGTSFLLYVAVISIIVYTFFGWPNVWMRVLIRLLMIPVIAGISFEIIRLMGKYDNALVNTLSRPGMWLQGFTTREPDDSQLEVAIAAFEGARGFEK